MKLKCLIYALKKPMFKRKPNEVQIITMAIEQMPFLKKLKKHKKTIDKKIA